MQNGGNAGEPIWRDRERNLLLRAERVPSPAIIDLLGRTEWGTRDVKYMVRDIPRILDGISDPHYLLLETDGRLLAVVVASRKRVRAGGSVRDGLFISMIAVDRSASGAGYGKLLAAKAREFGRSLLGPEGIIYLYVETTNIASIRVHERVGYRRIGRFEARLFVRIFPRDDAGVSRALPADRPLIAREIERQYAGHALLDVEEALQSDGVFVLRDGGNIIAGAEVRPMHWSLRKLRGVGGALAMHVLPRLPLVRREYSPERFRFLEIGSVWSRPGHERALDRLLSALLNRSRVHVGMLFLDARSPARDMILASVSHGLLSGLALETAEVFADTVDWSAQDSARLADAPLVISPLDPM